MQRIKRLTAIILSILTISSVCAFGTAGSASASSTGAGLAEWALNAYYSGWSYVYGGSSPGAVDCSGLIYSYCGGDRVGDAQLGSATESGSVSSGIPRVHGLGLYMPGHVGVYVGDGMAVDARGDEYGVCYESVYSYMGWTTWFKLSACSYVTNGWEKFNGNYYYYENGQYIVDTSRTIDGNTYYFDSTGCSSDSPSSTSNSSSESSSSGSKSEQSTPTSWGLGSSGEEVKKIQQRLADLGYYNGAVDGEFGSLTEQAFMDFQRAAGLTPDGIAGSDREILYSDDAPTPPKQQEKAEENKTEEVTTPAEETEEETKDEKQPNVYKNGDENDGVTDIQTRLAQLGYFDIEPTGYFGDYTAQAIMNFQLANGIEVTGIVDEATLAMLNSAEAVENPYAERTLTEDSQENDETVILPNVSNLSDVIITSVQNQNYSDTAADVVAKTNGVTQKALAKSSSVVAAAEKAQVQRSASVGLWFAIAAIILAGLATVFFIRDRKENNTRYARYSKKKKKLANSSITEARW